MWEMLTGSPAARPTAIASSIAAASPIV